MNKKIIPWKNVGGEPPEELFLIRWDIVKGEWIKDPNGKHVGYESSGSDISVRKLEVGTPSLGVSEEEE